MPDRLTWKAVFIIWLLALPFLGATGKLAYDQNPKPFKWAAAIAMKGYGDAGHAYKAYQAKQAKAKAAEEKKAREAEQASTYSY